MMAQFRSPKITSAVRPWGRMKLSEHIVCIVVLLPSIASFIYINSYNFPTFNNIILYGIRDVTLEGCFSISTFIANQQSCIPNFATYKTDKDMRFSAFSMDYQCKWRYRELLFKIASELGLCVRKAYKRQYL